MARPISPAARPISPARGTAFWTWLGSVVITAAVVYGFMAGGQTRQAALIMGLLFSAYMLAAYAIAGRLRAVGPLVLLAWGAGFAAWLPPLADRVSSVIHEHAGLLGRAGPGLADQLVTPATVVLAGSGTGLLLFLATGSVRCVVQTVLLSLIAGLAPLAPAWRTEAVHAGIILWHAGVAGSLCRWAVVAAERDAVAACERCSFETVGVRAPDCPACGKRLSLRTRRLAERAAARPAPPAPAARWF